MKSKKVKHGTSEEDRPEQTHKARRGLETVAAREKRLGIEYTDSGHPPGEKAAAYITLVVMIVAAMAFNYWQPTKRWKEEILAAKRLKAAAEGIGELALTDIEKMAQKDLPGAEGVPVMISQSPRVYVFDNFMSKAECEFLMKLVDGRLEPAKVVASTEDKYNTQTQTRNNEQIWLTQQEETDHPVLRHVIKRMHRVARIPDTNAEALQIGRYEVGTKYEGHVDSDPPHDVARPMTLIAYLKDVEEGGYTMFPLGERRNCSSKWHVTPSGEKKFGCHYCCELPQQDSLRVKPKQGRAVLFFSHTMEGKVDARSEHIACPTHKGVKWIAQRWFRFAPYQNIKYDKDPRFDGLAENHFPKALKGSGPWDGNLRLIIKKSPRVYIMENFLTAEECKQLMSLGSDPALEPVPKEDATDPERRIIPLEMEVENPVLARIAKRLNLAAYAPDTHAEPMQLEVYSTGGDMGLQLDSDDMEKNRPLTIQIFLNDMSGNGGGETLFPVGKCKTPEECCKHGKGLQIKPRQGRAVLFYNEIGEGKGVDPRASHAACPVKDGKKWMVQRWYRATAFSQIKHKVDPTHNSIGKLEL